MSYIQFSVLSIYLFSSMINQNSSQSIKLNMVTNLWPVLEKNEIFQPTTLVSNGNGDIYVFDDGSKKIYKFSSSFELVKSFGGKGQGPGEFSQRIGKLLISPDNKLVALENRRKTIHYFDLQGNFLHSLLIEDIGTPYDLAFDPNGNLYFTDLGFYINPYHILIYDRGGTLLEKRLADEYFITWGEVTQKGTPREQAERIAHLLAQHHRKIAINRDSEIFIGRFDKYVLEKYSSNFELLWRKKMEFERKVLPHAGYNRRGTMPEALNSAEGDGAIADMKLDEKYNIFVSVGLERSFEDSDDGHIKHWIDVFDNEGNHLSRLLENELPHNQRGYRLDIFKNRLMILGEDRLLVYNIVYK